MTHFFQWPNILPKGVIEYENEYEIRDCRTPRFLRFNSKNLSNKIKKEKENFNYKYVIVIEKLNESRKTYTYKRNEH